MNIYQFIGLTLSILTIIVIPLLVFTIRSVVRWSRMEDKIVQLAEDMKDIQVNHDRRISWLEQNLWRRSQR